MKPPRFEYHAPASLDEALALLAEHGDEAKVLAGGQSLVPLLAMRLARPAHVVDVNLIDPLSAISDGGDHVAFGATVRERAVERSALVRQRIPLLAEAVPYIGHVAIRNRGTIGGSIAHGDASAELPAVAVTTGASMLVQRQRGTRIVAAEEFFQGHFTTGLADDECLVEVRVPTTAAGVGWAFEEVARRHGDFAIVGVAAMVALARAGTVADSRITLIGVADRPLRARDAESGLVGAQPSTEAFDAAARTAAARLEPASDVHGSAAFRRHLAMIVVRRALTNAAARAEVPS